MHIQQFIDTVRAKHKTGVAGEHSYRPALEALFAAVMPGISVINEPTALTDVGAPDFSFSSKGIAIGWCEAKDVPVDLGKLKDANADQKRRYLKGLPNLIYTNGLDWEFYKDGEKIRSVCIGVLAGSKIESLPDHFETLLNQLKSFAAETPQSITSAKKLAQMMAGKAVLIKDIMGNTLRKDADLNTELTNQFKAFRAHLIHDIDADEFADVYAETIAYGLFAARLHDPSQGSFDRREALDLLPKSNPFLRSLFGYIAGVDLDDRIAWVIDELCDVLRACNLHELMKDFGKWTARNDPFLHFYETFLAEYNPAKRKARGVWYTPEPVVNFIVRAVDDVLKTEFGLPLGLADTSKITVDWDTGQTDAKGKRTTIKKQVHRVQILDPATGTGTFLAEAIKQIAVKVQGVAPGMWSHYVEADLIPRIHGFELLMASYAMCNMKLDMMLSDLGYVPSASPPRLSVYLTNSLEEGDAADQQLPFAAWLSAEAKGANTIKRDTPIMCVIGNPPYSGISQNNGTWISDLIEDYKYVDGVHFGERKHWLHDDYVKFIRFAEHMIDKNGEGVLGFITNHGYLDNPTFRGMRRHLLATFDKIYVLDLHGNAKKKEACPDGGADKNVFDIQQGVSIIIAVKKIKIPSSKISNLSLVKRRDVWGAREVKSNFLWIENIYSDEWSPLDPVSPFYVLTHRDQSLSDQYGDGFGVDEAMAINVTGMVSARDSLVVDFNAKLLESKIARFRDASKSDDVVRNEFFGPSRSGEKYLPGDSRGWRLGEARKAIAGTSIASDLQRIAYRPFDTRFVYYRPDMVDWGREKILPHFIRGRNIGLSIGRQGHVVGTMPWNLVLAHSEMSDFNLFYRGGVLSFPLYLYPEPGSLDTERRVNFDPKIYAKIRAAAGLGRSASSPIGGGGPPLGGGGGDAGADGAAGVGGSTPPPREERGPPPLAGEDQEGRARLAGEDQGVPDELRVFDYIYGVLHCPDYRATYAQFLKIDFPRIPYPASPEIFAAVADKGGQLRALHLMDDAAVGEAPYPFIGSGDGVVVKPVFVPSPLEGEGDSRGTRGGVRGAGATVAGGSATVVSADGMAVGEVPLSPLACGESPSPSRGEGRVYINADQFFDNVPEVAWNFHIGGYQPAQKWLKDRKGRALGFDDVRHYQKIIKILAETDRIMREIVLPLDAAP